VVDAAPRADTLRYPRPAPPGNWPPPSPTLHLPTMPRTHRLSAAAAVAVAVLLVGGPGRAAAQSRHSEAGATSAATPAAAGTAHTISDRNRKENFRPVDGEALLRYLRDIPVTSWNYIGHDDSVRHIGPMAQDWERVFGLSGD